MYDRKMLIRYFHYQIYAFHYRLAIKTALRGRLNYLGTLLHVHSSILWPKWQQMVFCLPFAILNFRQLLTYHLAKTLINHQAELDQLHLLQ
jgi:hypothetical protein